MSKIIAIDFDNTLFKTDWPDILEPIWEVIERAKEEQRNGAKLILWTCRCGKYLDEAVEACRAFGLIFDAVNENLHESIEMFDGSDSRKVFAHEYWDDLAINPSELSKPKKQMTFREEVAKKEPERIDVIYRGGVAGCPRDKCVSRCHIMNQVNCTKCWDRVIPDELMDND